MGVWTWPLPPSAGLRWVVVGVCCENTRLRGPGGTGEGTALCNPCPAWVWSLCSCRQCSLCAGRAPGGKRHLLHHEIGTKRLLYPRHMGEEGGDGAGVLGGAPAAVLGAGHRRAGPRLGTPRLLDKPTEQARAPWARWDQGRREHRAFPTGFAGGLGEEGKGPRLDPGAWVKGVTTCLFRRGAIGGEFGVKSELGFACCV